MNKQLHVISAAGDLVKYTLDITNNIDKFPKKVRFTLTNRIQNKALDIQDNLFRANEYDLRIQEERKERRRLQREAIILCKGLLYLIELSLYKKYISDKSCKYWSKITCDVLYMTSAWLKKDRSR